MIVNGFDTNKMSPYEPPFCTENDAEIERLEARIEDLEALLLLTLLHHQGASSPIGKPIRAALNIGQYDALTSNQILVARTALAGKFDASRAANKTAEHRATALSECTHFKEHWKICCDACMPNEFHPGGVWHKG